MRANIYKFSVYTNTVSNTVPGRCYSIQELLSRVMRGQPLPMIPPQYEETHPLSEDEIEQSMELFENHPMFDRDADIIEASNYVQMINSKEKAFKPKKNKKK